MKRKAWRKLDKVIGPQGEFEVSTVRTYSGGAPNEQPFGSPFGSKDYADETPWPYETMVFASGSSRGKYHQPHTTQEQAEIAHGAVIEMVKNGTLNIGHGVKEPWGNPSTTPEQWRKVAEPA